MMDIKHLIAFQAVGNCGSFSEATQATRLSQPTLSRLVKQLEDELNIELISRYHRPLQLTEAGEFFYQRIEQLLIDLDATVVLTKKIANPASELNIGFVPSVLYGMLPTIISELKQQIPHQHIHLKDISTFGQIKALKAGEIDFGFGRFATHDDDILQILLRHERFVVALPKDHPLANQSDIALHQLLNDTLILYHQTHLPFATADHPTEPLQYLFSKHNALPASNIKVSDIQVALGLVVAGLGITLVPASLQSLRQNEVAYCSLKHENATSPIYLSTLSAPRHPLLSPLLNVIYALYEQKGFTYTPFKMNDIN